MIIIKFFKSLEPFHRVQSNSGLPSDRFISLRFHLTPIALDQVMKSGLRDIATRLWNEPGEHPTLWSWPLWQLLSYTGTGHRYTTPTLSLPREIETETEREENDTHVPWHVSTSQRTVFRVSSSTVGSRNRNGPWHLWLTWEMVSPMSHPALPWIAFKLKFWVVCFLSFY